MVDNETPPADGSGSIIYSTETVTPSFDAVRRFRLASPEQISERDIAKMILIMVDRRVNIDVDVITLRVLSPWNSVISFPHKTLTAVLRYNEPTSLKLSDVQDIKNQIRSERELVIITPRKITSKCRHYIENHNRTHYIEVFRAPSLGSK